MTGVTEWKGRDWTEDSRPDTTMAQNIKDEV